MKVIPRFEPLSPSTHHLLPPLSLTVGPRVGSGSPFPVVGWDGIEKMMTADLSRTFIVENDLGEYVRDYPVGSLNDLSTFADKLSALRGAVAKGYTIKVEGLECWSREYHILSAALMTGFRASLHLYVGQAGGGSFGMHTDPDPVVVIGLQGRKTFRLEGYESVTLEPGGWVYIPAGLAHEAVSEDRSAIWSVGFHAWTSTQPSYLI